MRKRPKRASRRLSGILALATAGLLAAACSSSGSSSSSSGTGTAATSGSSASGQVTIGVDLTYNNTAFWAAYINYEQQYAQQMHSSCSARCWPPPTPACRTSRSRPW